MPSETPETSSDSSISRLSEYALFHGGREAVSIVRDERKTPPCSLEELEQIAQARIGHDLASTDWGDLYLELTMPRRGRTPTFRGEDFADYKRRNAILLGIQFAVRERFFSLIDDENVSHKSTEILRATDANHERLFALLNTRMGDADRLAELLSDGWQPMPIAEPL